ncbi:hypothetical protein QTP86_024143, partial [Hemibagrus guttatus]
VYSREPGAYPRRLQAQGRVHPGQDASLSQAPVTHITHPHSHATDNLEIPINLQRMSLDWGRKPEVPGGNPRGTGRTCKLHTHIVEVGIKPPTLEVCQTC